MHDACTAHDVHYNVTFYALGNDEGDDLGSTMQQCLAQAATYVSLCLTE